MREFLEDAHKHRDDGYGRAQAAMKRELPKRFYKEATTALHESGYAVLLDGRPTRTPGKKVPVLVPTLTLAEALAAEWAVQGERLNPETMPMIRLVNAALEGGADSEQALRDEIGKYVASDLLLYRAETPQELITEQEAHWDRALVALAQHFDVVFQPTVGILHQEQPEPTLARLAAALDNLGYVSLTALTSVTSLTGSGLLAMALVERLLTSDDAWAAAHVDEDHNVRLWGEDPEAKKRRDKRRIEFDAALRVLDLVDGH